MTTNSDPSIEAETTGQKLKESDITGLKYSSQLASLLERLHCEACERDRAGNRELHYDQYCIFLLLYLFNPIVTVSVACNKRVSLVTSSES